MPELPEVETVRRHIAPVLEGARIESVVLTRARMARRNSRPEDVVDRLMGRRVGGVGRHGKFLLIEVEGDLTWVIHLGMSGRMTVASPEDDLDPHTHLRVATDRGDEVRLIDPRTFGFVAVFTPEELGADPLARLGPDALDALPDLPTLRSRLAGRSAPIKSLLLDQRVLAGLGNIYADEVLFRAGIRPSRPGGKVTDRELAELLEAVPEVLTAGLASGGTSLADMSYLLPDGRAGAYLERLAVYGRPGLPCL
ncbi:MAG: bifunctional DNA-formamidopyrimidine glycosylase/DNA-(apurinic or apyrimidinic site) lyase, partial [Actinomycetota bacterium]